MYRTTTLNSPPPLVAIAVSVTLNVLDEARNVAYRSTVVVARGEPDSHAMKKHLWDISRAVLPHYFLYPHVGRMDDIWAAVCAASRDALAAAPGIAATVAGIAVGSIGHCHPHYVETLKRQVEETEAQLRGIKTYRLPTLAVAGNLFLWNDEIAFSVSPDPAAPPVGPGGKKFSARAANAESTAAAATSSDESRPPLVKTPSGTSDISSRFTARSSASRSSVVSSRESRDGCAAAVAALSSSRQRWMRVQNSSVNDSTFS